MKSERNTGMTDNVNHPDLGSNANQDWGSEEELKAQIEQARQQGVSGTGVAMGVPTVTGEENTNVGTSEEVGADLLGSHSDRSSGSSATAATAGDYLNSRRNIPANDTTSTPYSPGPGHDVDDEEGQKEWGSNTPEAMTKPKHSSYTPVSTKE